jgi:iron complex outermembrane receptor protein
MARPNEPKFSAKRTVIALAVANVLAVQTVIAEEADDSSNVDNDHVVVITATKRVQNMQEVPLAVTAVSGDELVKMQITDIMSLEKAIPGLTVASFGNNPQAVMRGAGAAGTTDIAVPIYHNGMYLPSTAQALAGYLDVERIEALKGPQGTLFGRNTFGGLINVITKKPDLEDFDVGVALSVGKYSLSKLEGFINIPLTDTMAFRFTAADEKRDPYVNNTNNPKGGLKDSDYSYARAQLLIQPNDDLSINIGTSYWKDTANGNLNYGYKPLGIPLDRDDPTLINGIDGVIDPRVSLYSGPNCPGGDRPGGRSVSGGNFCDGDEFSRIADGPFTIDYDYTPNRELKETAFYLNVDWTVANHSIIVNAAMFDFESISIMDADLSGRPGWVDGDHGTRKSKQIDLTISSLDEGPFHYTVGAYLFNDQDDDNLSAYLFGSLEESWSGYAGATPDTPAWASWNSAGKGGTKSVAIYGQADYSLTDKLNITAGLRYTEDDRRSKRSSSLGFGNLGPGLPTYDFSGSEFEIGKDDNVDYRIGFDYTIDGDLMVYSSFSTAYISGAVDAVTQKLLDPQTNEAFEVGFKSTLLDGKLRLNGALYAGVHDGLTTTIFEDRGDGVSVAIQAPGGSINSRGLEFEGFYYATEDLVIDFGLSFDFSEYDEFNVGAGNLVWNDQVPIGAGANGFYNMDGKDTPYTPDATVGVGVSYFIDLGEMGTLTPYLFTYYNSGYESNRAPVFFGEQGSYVKVDVSLKWQSADGNWNASLWVNNASDELITTYTEIYSRARVAQDYSAPRTYGLRMAYNF